MLQLAVVTTATFSPSRNDNKLQLFSAVASFSACLGLGPLLVFEHNRSLKPSDLGIVYILVSLGCDLSMFSDTEYRNTAVILISPRIAIPCVKAALLFIECRRKRPIQRGSSQTQWSPEEVANILDRVFFWWINPILAQGNRHVLTGENLPPLCQELSSKLLRQQALQAWDQRGWFIICSLAHRLVS